MENHNLIVVVGLPHHGKSTFASMIARAQEGKKGDTSDIVIREFCTCQDLNEDHVRGNKEWYRPQLVALGNHLCDTKGPSYLSRELIKEGCTVIAGPRRLSEIEDLDDPFVVWINKEDPDETPIIDNTEVELLKERANLRVSFKKGDTQGMLDCAVGLAYVAHFLFRDN